MLNKIGHLLKPNTDSRAYHVVNLYERQGLLMFVDKPHDFIISLIFRIYLFAAYYFLGL
jgi:hypothetical protein